jgi:Protein of unknown function (DUF2975)
METGKTDLLLLVGKILAIILQAAMAIAGVALLIAIPAVLLFDSEFVAISGMEEHAFPVGFPMGALVAVLLIVAVIVALMFVFFGKLRQIIGTVGAGDPFQPENARRLALMGWQMLGVQLLLIPAGALGLLIADHAEELDSAEISVETGLDPSGILLVVILFILARVFRHGAAMRAELEGTV